MTLWIKDPLAIFVEEGLDAGGGIVVDGEVITELVPAGGQPRSTVSRRLEAGRHVVLPGLIDAHHRYCRTLTGGIGPGSRGWSEELYPLWAKLRPNDLRRTATLAMSELLLSGCTTGVDHHDIFPKALKKAIDIELEVAGKLGMRTVLTRGSINFSREDGGAGLPAKALVQDDWTILIDCERLVKRHNQLGERKGAMVDIALGPSSPLLVTPELLRATAVMAHHLDCRLHTTLIGTEEERALYQTRFGMQPLDYLEEQGWLTPRLWLAAGGGRFTQGDIERFARAGVSIAYCPGSDKMPAIDDGGITDLERAGVALGLGTDGTAPNMMQAMRRIMPQEPSSHAGSAPDRRSAFGYRNVIRLATAGSAHCLGRSDIGRIAPGYQADLALFELDERQFAGDIDPLEALMLSDVQRADRVMVAGRWLVEDGRLTGIDLPKLREAHQKTTRKWRGHLGWL